MEVLRSQEWIDVMENRVYASACDEHPVLAEKPTAEIRGVIRHALAEIWELESVAATRKQAPNEQIKNAVAWIFSGPRVHQGVLSTPSYKDKPWAWDMDEIRITEGLRLAAQLGDVAVIYNGSDIENKAFREMRPWRAHGIAEDRVHVLGEALVRTRDQIETFVMPPALRREGRPIVVLSHAPHLMRVLHMINYFKVLPPEMPVYAYPLSSPTGTADMYAELEIRGLLYYCFVASEASASAAGGSYVVV